MIYVKTNETHYKTHRDCYDYSTRKKGNKLPNLWLARDDINCNVSNIFIALPVREDIIIFQLFIHSSWDPILPSYSLNIIAQSSLLLRCHLSVKLMFDQYIYWALVHLLGFCELLGLGILNYAGCHDCTQKGAWFDQYSGKLSKKLLDLLRDIHESRITLP